MSMQTTPTANRTHIAIFGRRNSGKSTLVNAISGQQTAIVSDVAGTTTDPVYKNMEIQSIGPCTLIDTAGFDDVGDVGKLRMEKTEAVLDKTDVAVLICSVWDFSFEWQWISRFDAMEIPVILVVNEKDVAGSTDEFVLQINRQLGQAPIILNAKEKAGIDQLVAAIAAQMPKEEEIDILPDEIGANDIVILVMPQDAQAPKGRLILPQVQTIREMLDKQCIAVCTTLPGMQSALAGLKQPPKWIITDSQVFGEVHGKKPSQSKLTSFSVLFAAYKGDIAQYKRGADQIDKLQKTDRVLIAESCTHKPMEEDIGRVKIPALLRKKVGDDLQIDIVAGSDFPADLGGYALVIQCGGCMFNRKHVMGRIRCAKNQNVPITNYGIAIAKLSGILDQISI